MTESPQALAVSDAELNAFCLVSPDPFLLLSRLSSYPTAEIFEDVRQLMASGVEAFVRPVFHPTLWETLHGELKPLLENPQGQTILAARYIDLFDRAAGENSLHETEYGASRSQLKTNELSDIAAFYEAFGFRVTQNERYRNLLDHVSVEAEFYALLLAKLCYLLESGDVEGAEIVHDARRKFIESHLGRFMTTISLRPGVERDPFYHALFCWAAAFVGEECERLAVNPDIIRLYTTDDKDETLSCGSCGNLTK